jgi:hypothetical protein
LEITNMAPSKKPATAPTASTETFVTGENDRALLDAATSKLAWLRRAKVALIANEPFCLWGPPGVGKTDMLYLAHRVLFPGLPFYVLILSGRDPADVQGLSVYDPATGAVRLASWAWAQEFVAAGGGTLFLDELSTATGTTQAVGLRILQERKVGEITLPGTVRVIAAANPPDCSVDGEAFRAPTANRMGHIVVGRYANDAECKSLSASLADNWVPWLGATLTETPGEREAAMLVSGYVTKSPGSLFQFPGGDESRQGMGWPSPRSWHKYARILASAIDNGFREDGLLMADDWLGEGVGREWRTYARNADLPNPRDLIEGRATFSFETGRADKARVVVTGVATEAVHGSAADHADRSRLVEAAWGIVLAAANAKLADAVKPGTKALQDWRINPNNPQRLAMGANERAGLAKLGIALQKANEMTRK